ncbi:DNA mismatch repair protein MLH3 [Canna indica]|uniref:DNA mismatch repair protein MLH3 n=1 Tax=Canna indica TaxID=4628 RepID=A0AAQ3KD92_9LILI|nr:DNA mismatch repair protein MLH3 [Canna indica]
MQHIKRLPRNIHGPLQSSVVIFDLPRVVEELLNNSLDAASNKVCVYINVRECYVKVEDDGCGITRDELVILGEKYATSRSSFLDDMEASHHGLGFKGEALLSLSDISIVEVRTKARGKPNAYCKIIKGSRCLFLGIDDQRECVGTTVIARDLFYNQPVRRRYMQSSSKKVLHCVKKVVARAALAHPQVSFKLIDSDSEDELLCTIPSSSPLPLVSSIFGNKVSGSLHEIAFSDGILKLSGYLSEPGDACSSKALQYLYVNLRFVSKGPVHNLLNSLASNVLCSLALHAVDPLRQTGKRQKIQANLAFVLNLCCPVSLYDLHFEPSKTIIEFKDWDTVLTFFEEAVRKFWQQHIAPSLQGSSFSEKNDVPRNSETQTEESSIRDPAKSFNVTKSSNQICQNSLHIPMITPLDFESEDIGVSHDREKSNAKLKRSFMNSESRQIETDCFGEPDSLEYVGKNAKHFLDSRYDNMIHTNIGRYEDSAKYLFLDNHVIPKLAPQFEKRHDFISLGWKNKCPEIVKKLNLEATCSATSPDLYDTIVNAKEVQYSPPCSVLSNFGNESTYSCSLKRSMKCDAAYYSRHRGFNVSFGWPRSDFFLCDNIDLMDADYSSIRNLNFRDTFHQEIVDAVMPSPYTIRKCQTTKHVDVSSTGLIDPYSFHQGCLNNAQMLDIGSRCGSPSPPVWHARPFRTGFDPAKRNTSVENLMSFEDSETWIHQKLEHKHEYLSTTQHRSIGVLPSINCTMTILDANHSLNPKREMHCCYPSDEMAFENVCLSSKINGKISFFSSDTLDFNDKENDFKPKLHNVQKDNVRIGNQWDRQEFCSQQLALSSNERSRRSQSAPPFYRGKRKFPVLSGSLTSVAAKKPRSPISNKLSETGCLLDQLPRNSASPPCPDLMLSEDSQSHLIEPINERPSSFEVRHSQDVIYDVPEYSSSELAKWRPGVQQTTDTDSPHMPVEQTDDILNISSGLLHFSGDSLVPELVDKNCLNDARVLFQLDKKFIPVVASGNLMIIDQHRHGTIVEARCCLFFIHVLTTVQLIHVIQHAADERIRLEELRRQVLSGEGRKITYLDSEEEMVLPEMVFQLLQKYAEKIHKWGWIFNTHSLSPELFNKNLNLLKRNTPGVTLVAVPCILGINLTDKDLLEYIEQLVETDGSSNIPPSVLRILNFKACRGAIMFGDSLLPSECSLIVEELKATSLCFQCAHGRPTTVPLLNMSALHEQLAKLKINKGSSDEKTWHGLCRRRPSIQHARLLLNSAKRFLNG